MRLETVKSNEASNLFDQVNLPQQIHSPRRRNDHLPSVFSAGKLTTKCAEAGLDLCISNCGGLSLLIGSVKAPEQTVQGTAAQRHHRFRSVLSGTQPGVTDLGFKHLTEERKSTSSCSQRDLPGQPLLVAAAGIGALPRCAAAVTHRRWCEQS